MEGYRACLILAAAEFDTYGCIRRLARHPESMAAWDAFNILLRRANVRVGWRMTTARPEAGAEAWYLHRCTGASIEAVNELLNTGSSGGGGTPVSLMDVEPEKQMDVYIDLVRKMMPEVDLHGLMDKLNIKDDKQDTVPGDGRDTDRPE